MSFKSLSHRPFPLAATFLVALSLSGGLAKAADSSDASVERLPAVTVSGSAALAEQFQIPQTVQTVTAAQIDDTVNIVDVEDAVKYDPSLFVRKRNYGDTQPVLATRTWGVNSSARSLVYADGVLLTALVANNNSIGAPRWGVVSPSEIQQVDVLYGPYSAAYPGNSMGAVMEITTRMPEHAEASLQQTEAFQAFSIYHTSATYSMSQTAVTVGDRVGKWSFWISANGEDSHTQPLTFVTAGALPAGTTGGIVAWNKLGQAADVLGASGILHADFGTVNLKLAYDLSPGISAAYNLGLWENVGAAKVQSYLLDANGQPTYAGQSGFASGTYNLIEEHLMQSVVLKSICFGDWDWKVIGSTYSFDKDNQRNPSTASATGTSLGLVGKAALLTGTGWSTIDLKAAWHPDGRKGGQELSFGAHDDTYKLVNPTYNTPDWTSGQTFSSLASEGNGNTETKALWLQDAWSPVPDLKATVGGRYESWRAYDGINVNGATTIVQPTETSSNVSPKATLAWSATKDWTVTASAGNAYRYPTASELYQLVTTGATFTSPNPNLKPEEVWSEELKAERKLSHGLLRVSLFEEDVSQALISQYGPLVAGSATNYQYVMNVGKLRNRGVEVFVDQDNVLTKGLELSASVTYVDSRILEDSGLGQFSTTVGKKAPYVPMWRGTFVATYRPIRNVALSVAGRYSGQQYSTVDNTDVNPNVYQGFDEFFVLDTHAHWKVSQRWDLSGGVDNLLNRKYFLFHPFPQRTVVVEAKLLF